MTRTFSQRAPMTSDEFQSCLDRTGLSQLAYADLTGISGAAVRYRKKNPESMPLADTILMRILADHPNLLPEAWAAAGMPEGRLVRPPGGQPKDAKALEKAKMEMAKKSLGKKRKSKIKA